MIKKNNILPLLICSCFMVQGCAPDFPSIRGADKAVVALPDDFAKIEKDTELTTPKVSKFTKPKVKLKPLPEKSVKSWNLFYSDAQLNGLIAAALNNNQELHIIEQEIAIANNEVMARRGEYLPKVGAGAGYTIEKVGNFTSQGRNDEATGVKEVLHNKRAGLFMNWEVDIWKRLRNATKAAYFRYLSTIEGKNFMVTNLIAEISATYYELMALEQQLTIVKNYISTLEKARDMVQWQQEAARATSLAVRRFDAEVLKNKSRKFALQQKIILTENELNSLIGRFPIPIEREKQDFMSLALFDVQVGLPSALLDNRPDVRKAALELKATKLDVKAARVRFYPALSIDAAAGYESFNSNHFLKSPESLFYNLAANLSAPLLNRLAIKADYFSANNRQIAAIFNYEMAIIKAYTEVVSQLAAVKNLQKVYDLKQDQVAALLDSTDIADMLFKAARVDYIDVLLTQRDALKAQIELVDIKKQQLIAHVNLYRALGGGWYSYDGDLIAKTTYKNNIKN
jgi:outer membrane protein, multidrug efflux system